MTVEERFWSRVERGPDCWIWTGSRGVGGYGRFYYNGKSRPAHRVAWELANGVPFPEGLDGCHTCDNPPCVNPSHIFPGTKSENARDALRKGRLDVLGNGHKTHCKRGHELSPENTYVYPESSPNAGYRGCRTCRTMLRSKHEDRAISAAMDKTRPMPTIKSWCRVCYPSLTPTRRSDPTHVSIRGVAHYALGAVTECGRDATTPTWWSRNAAQEPPAQVGDR